MKINPHIADLKPYVPGEQLQKPGIIKLNTNECPFPPSKRVIEAVHATLGSSGEALRKYPNPTSQPLRGAVAEALGFEPNQVLVGNGSDEILRLVIHAFVPAGERIATLSPTYSLYPVLGEMFGGVMEEHPAEPDEALPDSYIESAAALKFLPNPNPPFGTVYPKEDVERLIAASKGLVVLDEAYAAFSSWTAEALAAKHDNVVVSRTFSKSHALAGGRVGFCLASDAIVERLNAIRDSYNINALSQAAALAAWNDTEWLDRTVSKIIELRGWLKAKLEQRGFKIYPSGGNFLFAEFGPNSPHDGGALTQFLKSRDILVRHFAQERLKKGIRITIGTQDELNALLAGIDAFLDEN